MVVRQLIRKGADHIVNCEDDLHLCQINESIVVSGVFDGCSTGTRSHFASSLFATVFKKICESNKDMFIAPSIGTEFIAKHIYNKMFENVSMLMSFLSLTEMDLLSTFIISVSKGSNLTVIVSGDGCIYINKNQLIKIESENNEPNYLAYHISKDPSLVYSHNIKTYSFSGVSEYAIATDGIFSFKKAGEPNVEDYMIEQFLNDTQFLNSNAMLARKWNILSKNGYVNYDDLSIIRVVL